MRRRGNSVSHLGFAFFSIAFLAFSALCYEMPKYKYEPGALFYQGFYFYGALAGTAALGLVLILVGHIAFRIKPNWILIAALSLLLIGNSLALGLEDISGVPIRKLTFVFSMEEKIRFGLAFALNMETLYFLLGVLPRFGQGINVWNFALALIVIIVLGLCLYALITEWKTCVEMVQGISGSPGTHGPTSARNFWGMILMLGFFACLIGQARTHAVWWFIPMVVIVLMTFFSRAKSESTAILLSGLLYVIYAIIAEWKRNRGISIFCICFLSVMLVSLGLCFLPVDIPYLGWMKVYYQRMIENFIDGSPMSGRDWVFRNVFAILQDKPVANMIGYGNYLPNYVINSMYREYGYIHSHNAWLELVLRGGGFRFLIYGGGCVYFLFLICKGLIVRRRWHYFALLCCIVGYGVFSAAEFINAMDNDVWGILLFVIFIMPVLRDKYAEKETDFAEGVSINKRKIGSFDLVLVSVILAGIAGLNAYAAWILPVVMAGQAFIVGYSLYRYGLEKAYEGVLTTVMVVACAMFGSYFGVGAVATSCAYACGFAVIALTAYAMVPFSGASPSAVLSYGDDLIERMWERDERLLKQRARRFL